MKRRRKKPTLEDRVFTYARPVAGIALVLLSAFLYSQAPLLALALTLLGLWILYRRPA